MNMRSLFYSLPAHHLHAFIYIILHRFEGKFTSVLNRTKPCFVDGFDYVFYMAYCLFTELSVFVFGLMLVFYS